MTESEQTKAILNNLERFLVKQRLIRKDQKLDRDESLLEPQILDSLAIMDLTAYIENTFSIMFDEQDLVPETFESLNALKNYIVNKMNK